MGGCVISEESRACVCVWLCTSAFVSLKMPLFTYMRESVCLRELDKERVRVVLVVVARKRETDYDRERVTLGVRVRERVVEEGKERES